MTLIGAFRLHFTSSTHFSLDASAFDHLNVSRIWSLRVCAVQRHDCFGVPTLQQRKIAVLRQIINSLNHRPGLLVIQGPPLQQPRGGFSHVKTTLQSASQARMGSYTMFVANSDLLLSKEDMYSNSNCIHIVLKALRALAYVRTFRASHCRHYTDSARCKIKYVSIPTNI